MNYIDIIKQVFSFLGGLGLFLYGMHVMSVGLQKAAGNKMKQLLAALTKNKFFGVLVGTLVTSIIQSSSATTVMVVGFVNAGLMNLTQSVGIIMGANIGTTVTAWLVASAEWLQFFNPVFLAPLAVAVGAGFLLFASKDRTKHIGEIIVGFGVLFVGMSTMSNVLSIYRDSEVFRNVFITLGRNPLLGLLAGTVVTGIIQSSSASVAILQSVAMSGFVPFGAAVYIIMGQNIGTCVTAILSSIGASRNAKAASYIHLIFNILGSIIFTVIAVVYFKIFNTVIAELPISATQISIIHSMFNIINTVLLYHFSNQLIALAKRLAWGKVQETEEISAVHLDERILDTPYFAIQNTVKEIVRLGDMVNVSLKLAAETLADRDTSKIQTILTREEDVDTLTRLIASYLVKLSSRELNEQESTMVTSLINIINNIERVGDHCENMAELAQFYIDENVILSDTAHGELKQVMDATLICYEAAIKAFEQNDVKAAESVAKLEDEVDRLEALYREAHIDRLKAGVCTPTGGVFLLDALTNLERIGDHALNISEYVIDENAKYNKHKRYVNA
ncbi:MAG: Na/Pi cotransporter family protein [Clostridiales bacterium]|jgi:phosphate:Na+ symporter|nr:Na/Pi cotransporter family protein [Clostridiales bacterium]